MDCDEWACDGIFLSTLSLRRATRARQNYLKRGMISIHALLAESDSLAPKPKTKATEFLSTLSLRRATPAEHHANSHQEFLSTLSLRRATSLTTYFDTSSIISIHALLAESDGISLIRIIGFLGFLSTLSLRRATLGGLWVLSIQIFLSTLSLRRATGGGFSLLNPQYRFLSTLSLRRATTAC